MAGGSSPQAAFVGIKLRVARTFRGLGQAELGERLALGRTLLGQLEVGARLPDPELMAALATELGFTRAFFTAPLADEVRDDECHGLDGLLASGEPARRRGLAHLALLAELVAWLDDRVRLPEENLPDDVDDLIDAGDDVHPVDRGDPGAIEAAADTCRRLWGLAPDLPVPNLTRVLERAGVVVARVEGAAPIVRAGKRLVVVVDAAPHAHGGTRLALARAAGHVILHRGADPGPALAAEADQFAGALLLPREGLLRELPRTPTLDGEVLAKLALRWKVSLGALVRRAAALPIANASRYGDAAPHLATTTTPADLEEVPEVLALALDELSRVGRVPRPEVARRMGWPRSIFTAVTGLSLGDERGNRVVSLAEWKARSRGASGASTAPAPNGGAGAAPALRGGASQLELDFRSGDGDGG